jgi:predicted enzyme related to lactoylglutathione lyase
MRRLAMDKDGKICYIEMPATDAARSADFYSRVFGWKIRTRGDGATAFDDTTGQVSGAFVSGRPRQEAGLVVYIMVDDAEATLEKLKANDAPIVQPIGGDPGEITARFRDPGGNLMAIYQSPKP